jgi:hypothetical protein
MPSFLLEVGDPKRKEIAESLEKYRAASKPAKVP